MKKTTSDSPGESLKRKNDRLTLDFSNGSKKAWMRGLHDVRDNGLLTSPDVGLLNLTTPELERYIIQPTPTSAMVTTPTQILFPKSVTEEQEAYARGFVDALVELRMKQSPLTANGGIVCFDGQGSSYVALTPVVVPPNTRGNIESNNNNNINTLTNAQLLASPLFQRPLTLNLSNTLRFLPSAPSFVLSSPVQSIGQSQTSTINSTTAATVNANTHNEHGKSTLPAYSTVQHRSSSQGLLSSLQSSPTSNAAPLQSPIDMSNQDTIKLERKREKNRNAAQKCRSKKLERISRLEERASELKAQNTALATTANEQRECVTRLRQQIVDHVHNGCRIMIVRDSATSA